MLPPRDHQIESNILNVLLANNINYAVLQQDWDSVNHGDIDIVIDRNDWTVFVSTIKEFVEANNLYLVKAYEIEYGVICLVILTIHGTVFLDIAIASKCESVFGLRLDGVLRTKVNINNIPVICDDDYTTYSKNKRIFKKSTLKKIAKKIKNLPIIIRRLLGCTIFIRGAIIYIPYVIETNILKSKPVIEHVSKYLSGTLSKRYK